MAGVASRWWRWWRGLEFTTSLFPKDGTYMLPLKVAARKKMRPVDVGDVVSVQMRVQMP